MSLNARAWLALAALAAAEGLLVFVPAGTVGYWQAWVYLAVLLGASALMTLDLLAHDRALLERRMSGGPIAEKEPTQKLIMSVESIGFVCLLVVPALDHRFGWSAAPAWVALGGDALVALGLALIARVYRENSFAAATIEVAPDQRVISTGPYAVVRHPMYASASLYVVGTPLALGSYWGLLPLVVMAPFLVWRLLDEERILTRSLPGYADYQTRVRYRLVPHVW